LGYQKPLVWVKGGVASRGKMMGRSFDDVQTSPDRMSDGSPVALPDSTGGDAPGQDSLDIISYDLPQIPVVEDALDTVQSENYELVGPGTNISAEDYIPTPRGMVDPLFKDLNPLSRFYISHCEFQFLFLKHFRGCLTFPL
jgi:hypothetical protein